MLSSNYVIYDPIIDDLSSILCLCQLEFIYCCTKYFDFTERVNCGWLGLSRPSDIDMGF